MAPTIVFVPGLRDHVADHWQTLLAAELPGSRTVPPLTENGLSLAARVAALEATLAQVEGPVILVAHSAGVMIVVHWAQLATGKAASREIAGALLATPPDIASALPAGYPTLEALDDGGWRPIPRARLPFPSLVAVSSNDPLAARERAVGMARDWGSEIVDLGEVGHLNPASGFGPWPKGRELIASLTQAADVASATAPSENS
ncbi:MAG TPA: alpha/beta hydrolase [Caulobacteraceae bacterium]